MRDSSTLVAIDVLIVLNGESRDNLSIQEPKIFISRILLNKMLNRQWHTILLNMETMRVVGITLNKYQYIHKDLTQVIGNPVDLASLVVEYIQPWYYLMPDAMVYVCGSYKVYACEHRYLC